ncbi:glycosyltransferase WbuB [Clostridium thermosuccinogenes]|uniref:Glycosyltransferase WbuB n=1 Tax=Clostridium thermosuccinogenes TaxID=84032 RepID=A0A2K2FK03_9CLOT|nr:glycosyltransferase family 4 protein [Pseudoclostridium thermosuccinogenes]AUS95173.1 glycosyltransferase WbuB [Pseudoclostridium thermosuccinogenes]PNT99107.1 glycosyltransferase WbuB [Pseudoclostridium thermosuccinogenes]PNU00911.1 glycosyltransferase WbuB [Pseudoclostridium thermosuccinogenes]
MKQKKDILFLCQYFYPEYVSSATLPYDTAVALVKAGFSVGAMCGYPKEYNKSGKVPLKEVYEDIEIRRLKYIQLKRSNFIGRLINYFSFTFSVALRFPSLRNYKSIIVYSNPPVLPLIAAWASKLFHTKIVFVSYDVYPEIAHITNSISVSSIISKMMKKFNKTIFKHVNKVVALSNEMKDYLLEHRLSLKRHQVEVIPNWYEDKGIIDTSKSYKNELFKDLALGENLVVSYFGNMGICQDLDTILDAIRELKNINDIRFIFAGHGNKMEAFKSIVKEENLQNVTIYDFLHGQDFQDALNISDCFLVSLAEGLTGLAVPSKTYSYMMAGKPVIAIMGRNSDISKDLLENDAGFALEVGEVSKLVNAILELKNDKTRKELMGKNCRELFLKKYTKEKCTQQYVDMMKKILEAH